MARAAKAKSNGRGGGFEQTFNAIDKVLRNEAGQTTELDYTEQTSWMLFLKNLDDLESNRRAEAELARRTAQASSTVLNRPCRPLAGGGIEMGVS